MTLQYVISLNAISIQLMAHFSIASFSTGENRYACPHLVEWGPSSERRMCGVKAPCAICLLHHRHEVHGFDKDRGVTEHPWVEVPDSNMDIPLSVATINYGARRHGKEKAEDDHLQGEETVTMEDQDSDVDAEGDDEDQCEILYSLPILSAPIINTPVPTYNAANTYAHNPNTLLGHRINPSNAPRPQRAAPYPSPYHSNTRVGPIVPVPSMSRSLPAAPAQRAVQMTDFLLYNQIVAAHLRYDPVLAAFVEEPVYELQMMSYDGLRDRLLGSAGNAGQGFRVGYSR